MYWSSNKDYGAYYGDYYGAFIRQIVDLSGNYVTTNTVFNLGPP